MGTLIDRIARAVEARIVAALEAGGPEYDELYDRTYTDARARGLDNDAAHAEAGRVAEAWLAENAKREKE